MSHRYAPVPNPRSDPNDRDGELEAAFDYSEDEDDDHNISESQPLKSSSASNSGPSSHHRLSPSRSQSQSATVYDFENVDYDFPPPGSPPRPSSMALPNNYGNSNGYVPSFDDVSSQQPRPTWFRRVLNRLPPSIADRLGGKESKPRHPIGGGTNNDGVFSNVTAKPGRTVRIEDGSDIYLVPEDTRTDAPPSYASAQADAVPPYWETTIHAPFSPDAIGEMIIEGLPTGSLFSFLWNMLVSVSFQFVGFLLTYLLHTTHAARLGSRAGLGVTLIQYGFALRGKMEVVGGEGEESTTWGDWNSPHPTFGSAAEAEAYYRDKFNATMADPPGDQNEIPDATADWLSFFLMTVGWFILLTSVLGFYRVKRWERGVLASQRETRTAQPDEPSANQIAFMHRLETMFRLEGVSRVELFRQGFGLGRRQREDRNLSNAEEGNARDSREQEAMIPRSDSNNLDRSRAAAVLSNEQRLHRELRAAGLL
ncbi:hypothetical protein AX16_001056 [Volvariella volvacea WC 439]|nr:hypothetical protein AX16_001056 [Volvariella volvacea WC 439]